MRFQTEEPVLRVKLYMLKIKAYLLKASFIIYTDLECKIVKTDWCKNNLENSSTTKVSQHMEYLQYHHLKA